MDHDGVIRGVERTAVAAARAALPMPAKVLFEIVREGLGVFVGTGNDRLKAAVQAEIEDGVLRRLPEVERKVSELQEQGVSINTTDVVRVIDQYARAWRDAGDAKKRKLLEDAFVNSFSRELYESGLLNVLWDKLDRLSYGDLFLLRDVIDTYGDNNQLNATLNAHDVVSATGLGRFHIENLRREDLLLSATTTGEIVVSHVHPTELGKRLRNLAFDANPTNTSC